MEEARKEPAAAASGATSPPLHGSPQRPLCDPLLPRRRDGGLGAGSTEPGGHRRAGQGRAGAAGWGAAGSAGRRAGGGAQTPTWWCVSPSTLTPLTSTSRSPARSAGRLGGEPGSTRRMSAARSGLPRAGGSRSRARRAPGDTGAAAEALVRPWRPLPTGRPGLATALTPVRRAGRGRWGGAEAAASLRTRWRPSEAQLGSAPVASGSGSGSGCGTAPRAPPLLHPLRPAAPAPGPSHPWPFPCLGPRQPRRPGGGCRARGPRITTTPISQPPFWAASIQ